MRNYSAFVVAIVLTSACQTVKHVPIPPELQSRSIDESGRTAVVDCRAGCHGHEKGCQESELKQARIDSQPGRYFDFTTLRIIGRANASDSPGLIRDPNWTYERFPANDSHPTSILVRPILATCEGRSKDTQGVTFYKWTADYFPLSATQPNGQ